MTMAVRTTTCMAIGACVSQRGGKVSSTSWNGLGNLPPIWWAAIRATRRFLIPFAGPGHGTAKVSRDCARRAPILALGGRDPVDRNAETKAADPLRQRMIDVFEAWWAHHGDILIKANDLHPDVLELIDFKAKRKDTDELAVNRQWVASYLRSKIGTRVGGFFLSQVNDTSKTRPVSFYKVQQTKEPMP